jgi:hypothetical protein
MSYFSAPAPDDYDDSGYSESRGLSRSKRLRINLGIFITICGLLGATFAANISLNGGSRKEFGQGVFQIKACDQWVGVGLQSASAPNNAYVGTVRLYGFDPKLCLGRIFKLKLFQTSNPNTPLNFFLDAGATAGQSETSTTLSFVDTTTALSASGYSTYSAWARRAVNIVDMYGRNGGRDNGYVYLSYYPDTGVYEFILTYPLAVVELVTSVTIESAKYN